MLKMTLSKIKKVCSSLGPRMLRGDNSYTLGKFQKLSITVLKIAEKSTKSEEENKSECEKCKELIELIFGPSQTPDTIQGIRKIDQPADIGYHHTQGLLRNELPEMTAPQIHVKHGENETWDKLFSESLNNENETKGCVSKSLKDSQTTTAKHKQCKKLIDLIFGPSELPDMINQSKKLEIPKSDIHQTHERLHKLPEMTAANISHAAQNEKFEKMYSESLDNPVDNYLHATTAKQTEEQLAQKVETIEEPPLVEAEKPKNEGFNVSPKILGKLAEAQSYANFENRKFDNEDTIVQTPNYESDQLEENIKMKHTIESMVRRIEETRRLEYINKLENIRRVDSMLNDETERSDFKSPVYNFAANDKTRKSGSAESENSYDEIAKRCLDAPSSQIDQRLLKEMQKLGVPNTGPGGEGSIIEENIIQMDVMKKPRKPIDIKELDLEMREFERDSRVAYVDKLYPAFRMANSPKIITNDDIDDKTLRAERIALCNAKPLTIPEQEEIDTMILEPRPSFNLNEVIIDPYDKKNIASDEDEKYDPLWYEKYSFTRTQTLQETAEEAVEDSSEIQSEETNRSPGAEVLAARAAITQAAPLREYVEETSSDLNNKDDPYIAFDSNQLVDANENWRYSEEDNTSASKDIPASETLQFSKPEPDTTQKQDDESTQYLTRPQAVTTELNPVDPGPKTTKQALRPISPESAAATEINAENLANEYPLYDPAKTYYTKQAEESIVEKTINEGNVEYPAEQISHSFIQAQSMVNPLLDRETLNTSADEIQKNPEACASLPKLTTDESTETLSEMLKRVRERNRMEFCQAYDRNLEEVQGKCGKKTPPCPPPAPKCPPPCPPPSPPCPPPAPRPCKPACPPPCPPPTKSPCQKFTKPFPANILGLLLQPSCCSQITASLPVVTSITERSQVVLTNEVLLKLQKIGLNLLIAYHRKNAVNMGSNFNAENFTLARDYEPWVPIPSWPIPKKEIKRPLVCPKEGCKLIPPPKLRPPCNGNPCIGFPKRTNSFSITNLLSSKGENVVFDILD